MACVRTGFCFMTDYKVAVIVSSAREILRAIRPITAAISLFTLFATNAVAGVVTSLDPAAEEEPGFRELGPSPTGQTRKIPQPEVFGGNVKSLGVVPTRAQVVAIYYNEYLPGNTMPAMNWTGSVATCNPGAIDVAYQQSMIDRVNVYRKLARLSPVVRNTTAAAANGVQAAALLMSANNSLSHTPPSSWTCYNTAYAGSTVGSLGGVAAGNSNIGLSSGNSFATNAVIDAYMVDSGASNLRAGHRTSMLDAEQAQMASGVVPGGSGVPGANALWVLDFGTRSSVTSMPDGVAWPPKDAFLPYQLLPGGSNRWSFQYPGANFSSATVTMTSGGAAYAPIAYDFKSTGCPSGFTCLPDDAIVWRPPLDAAGVNGVFYTSPGASDKAYTVNITGVTGSGVPTSFSYTVTVIDPSISPNQTISGTISNGTALSGVTFCARPATGVTCNASNTLGAYSCAVPNGWTGVLHAPGPTGLRIKPQSFSNVTTNLSGQNPVVQPIGACNLDVDNNGLIEPATDGVAILRRMLSIPASGFSGLSGTCAANTTSATVYAATTLAGYDVTGALAVRATTDGAAILRAMRGLTGTAVTNALGLAASGATRTDWNTNLRNYINTTCGSDFQ